MNENSVIKRIIKDMHKDYECLESARILIDRYISELGEVIPESVKIELYQDYVEHNEYSCKNLRKIMRTTAFLNWAHEDIYLKLEEFNSLYDFSNSNKLKLYRSIEVDFNFIDIAKNSKQIKTGIYWTNDYEYAIPYNSPYMNSGLEYIFHAEVDRRSVNWFKTFLLHICNVYGEDEKEIRLFNSKKIHNLKIEEKGEILFYDFKYKKCLS